MRLTVFVPLTCLMLSLAGCSDQVEFHGEFELQPYELPHGWRHVTAFFNEEKNELVMFGGLGNGQPSPPTPMNHQLFTVDVSKPISQQKWKLRYTDTVVTEPWFTSTNGFVEIDDRVYLACDDSDANAVYELDPKKYEIKKLSEPPAGANMNATDCCAVGVKLDRPGHAKDEVRIYMMGGRGDGDVDPVPWVRYYSVTHDRWERVTDLNVGRSHTGCASVKTGGSHYIYAVSGGDTPNGTTFRSLEVYDLAKDKWTLYEDFVPQGLTRLSVKNIDDKVLMLIGGDLSCAGGGPGITCADHPVTNVDLIEIGRKPRFVSGVDHGVPQLTIPRQSPGTALRKTKGKHGTRYELYVVAGRTGTPDDLSVAASTEVLSFELTRGLDLH